MSAKTRRLALLAAAAVLAPSAAFAANECTPVSGSGTLATPAGNATAPDSYSCTSATYSSGITYSSAGNLTVATTVATNVGATGVNLTATGADTVGWTSTAGAVTGAGAEVVEVRSATGAITVSTGAITGTAAGVTHGIQAISSGGGAVSVTTTGTVSASNATTGQIAIEASSQGGGNVQVVSAAASGRTVGIYARATGAGTVSVTSNGAISGATRASLEAITGTGLMTISANTGNISSTGATGILATAGGAASINIAAGRTVAGNGLAASAFWGIDLDVGGVGTITSQGTISGGGSSRGRFLRQAIQASGAGSLVYNNNGSLYGVIDLSGLAGGSSITHNNAQAWHTIETSTFSPGADTLINAAGSFIFTGAGPGNGVPVPTTTTFAFGGGADTFSNAGTLIFGEGEQSFSAGIPGPSEMIITGLETFNNTGRIFLGSYLNIFGATEIFSDNQANDRLAMQGVAFTGSGASTLLMDAVLSGEAQADCSAAVSADCIDLTGGSVAGSTQLVLRDPYFGYPGAYSPEGQVLVDVTGGTASAGAFTLSPNSDHYDASRGVLDKGVFIYSLVFDDNQFKIVGLPDAEAYQFVPLGAAAQDLWYVSTGTWFDRQADQRETMGDEGLGAGVWFRGAIDRSERTAVVDQEQKNWSLTFGADVISTRSPGQGFVAGVMLGYAHADVDFEGYTTQQRFSGMTGGLYASYMAGGFYVDAAVNGAGMTVDHDAPSLGLYPVGTMVTGNVNTVGGQVETGWRIPLGVAFVEPLAAATYVTTSFDRLSVPSADAAITAIGVRYDDAVSTRGAVGARVGMDSGFGAVKAKYSVTARLWNEFDGKSDLTFETLVDDLDLSDDASGQFTELGAAVALFSDGGALSGFLNVEGRFGDVRDGAGASAGLRYRW